MTRLLILGASPLPGEPQLRQFAANLRTWHFTKPLLDDGHQIRLVAGRVPKCYPEGTEPILRTERGSLEYFSLAADRFEDGQYVQRLCDEFDPEAIIGVNTYPSSRVARLRSERPMWCDLNGWIMAEAQAKAYVYGEDLYLSHFWQMEKDVLRRADAVSAVSLAQAHATVGELAVLGRLGRKNFGYEFVHTIPNAVSDAFDSPDPERKVLRGSMVPENAFVVLWVGGYNTWTDVDLLFEALTSVMKTCPDLHFVSTGGTVEGHDDITFTRFRTRAQSSEYGERFHFAGWVPTADMPCYYRESDLGINVDGRNYETVYGARNRLNEMMKEGLAFLTTLGTEVSHEVAEEGLCLAAAMGDAPEFARRMRWAVDHRQALREMAAKARAFALERYSYARTTVPLRAWATTPKRAPDEGERISFQDLDLYRGGAEGGGASAAALLDVKALLAVAQGRLEEEERRSFEIERRYHGVRSELGRVHQSKMWRLWMSYLRVRDWMVGMLGRRS